MNTARLSVSTVVANVVCIKIMQDRSMMCRFIEVKYKFGVRISIGVVPFSTLYVHPNSLK